MKCQKSAVQSTYGRLESKDPRSPKPIYVLIESERVIGVYTDPPHLHSSTYIGGVGTSISLRRTKRGFLFSTFEFRNEDLQEEDEEPIQYFTDNKFGDLLNLFLPRN
jgi:hypothetical protein